MSKTIPISPDHLRFPSATQQEPTLKQQKINDSSLSDTNIFGSLQSRSAILMPIVTSANKIDMGPNHDIPPNRKGAPHEPQYRASGFVLAPQCGHFVSHI
jgi:hypothetical protein